LPRLHAALSSPIRAFHFEAEDFAPLLAARPDLELVVHARTRNLVEALPEADLAVAWTFRAEWYERAPRLRWLGTPAAGHDWVAEDPSGRVPTRYGSFHGPMIAESLLGMMLHWNRRVPDMLASQRERGWDRDLQFPGRMLAGQRALIVGYGHIGRACARLLGAVGLEVVGCQRSHAGGVDPDTGARWCRPEDLPEELPRADHVILLLPGGEATRGAFDTRRLAATKPGAVLYNFGRGTTLVEADLVAALDEGPLFAAGLDVTEPEPPPPDSPLWDHPRVLLMPHSSCIYAEYRALYVEELQRVLPAA